MFIISQNYCLKIQYTDILEKNRDSEQMSDCQGLVGRELK